MGKKHIATVTQCGMTVSQPGTGVSVTSGYHLDGKVILNLYRSYNNLKNEFGGIGLSKRLDYDGKVFDNSDAAWAFALEHGYIRQYFKKAWKFKMVKAQ